MGELCKIPAHSWCYRAHDVHYHPGRLHLHHLPDWAVRRENFYILPNFDVLRINLSVYLWHYAADQRRLGIFWRSLQLVGLLLPVGRSYKCRVCLHHGAFKYPMHRLNVDRAYPWCSQKYDVLAYFRHLCLHHRPDQGCNLWYENLPPVLCDHALLVLPHPRHCRMVKLHHPWFHEVPNEIRRVREYQGCEMAGWFLLSRCRVLTLEQIARKLA